MSAPIIEVRNLSRRFGGDRRLLRRPLPALHAVQEVSFTMRRGETLGIVGESGCGKSTLARMLVGLDRPSGGAIRLDGEDIGRAGAGDGRPLAARVQYVFQDPVGALNPRKTVRATLEAPLVHLRNLPRARREARLTELMQAVKLPPEFLDRYPHEFSGGQAQRIGIARALAAEPEVIVLDEPVSALDVSVQAQVLNLLRELKDRLELTYLFISHDLSVVESISDRVAVMYFGRVVEMGEASALFRAPLHPYTRLLLDSAPSPGAGRVAVRDDDPGELPDPYAPPPGCAFAPRCPRAVDRCRQAVPPLEEKGRTGHRAACYRPLSRPGKSGED